MLLLLGLLMYIISLFFAFGFGVETERNEDSKVLAFGGMFFFSIFAIILLIEGA